MIVSTFLSRIDNKLDNVIPEEEKISWINELEQQIYSDLVEEYTVEKDDLVAAQTTYSLGDYPVSDLVKVEVNGTEYKPTYPTYTPDNTYYHQNGDIILANAPSTDAPDGLTLYFRSRPELKTVEDKDTQKLQLLEDYPYHFVSLYENYLLQKICTRKLDYAMANNYAMLFNETYRDFVIHHYATSPRVVARKRRATWREGV